MCYHNRREMGDQAFQLRTVSCYKGESFSMNQDEVLSIHSVESVPTHTPVLAMVFVIRSFFVSTAATDLGGCLQAVQVSE